MERQQVAQQCSTSRKLHLYERILTCQSATSGLDGLFLKYAKRLQGEQLIGGELQFSTIDFNKYCTHSCGTIHILNGNEYKWLWMFVPYRALQTKAKFQHSGPKDSCVFPCNEAARDSNNGLAAFRCASAACVASSRQLRLQHAPVVRIGIALEPFTSLHWLHEKYSPSLQGRMSGVPRLGWVVVFQNWTGCCKMFLHLHDFFLRCSKKRGPYLINLI